MPKIVPKSIQTCFELVLGQFLRKFFCPVFHGRSSLRKFSKNIKNFSKFQKCPKSFPKLSKRVLNVFWGNFFRKIFAQFPMEGRVFENFQKNQKVFKVPKTFKISKMPKKSFPKVSKRVLNLLGQIFRNLFCPVFRGGSRLRKISKKSKNFQNSKNVQNRSQKNPNVF